MFSETYEEANMNKYFCKEKLITLYDVLCVEMQIIHLILLNYMKKLQ